ncbi:MAG TPA: hypothetical protein VHL11_08965, partial [Phototrophicaceae bacterium]|nr:hypothetical protein [Phototrophicaceae bacterium]
MTATPITATQAEKSKIIFFMRAYNDMDHITPVIWKWMTTTNIPASLVVRLDKKAMNDYRV